MLVYGTGPVARAAAWHAAGVPISRVAPAVGLPVSEIARLILGFWLAEARDQDPDLELIGEPGACRIGGCGRAALKHRLCPAHVARFYAGRPLLGGGRAFGRGPALVVQECPSCGVRWCALGRKRATCGDRACVLAAAGLPDLRERDQAILARVRAGEQYRAIAADFGLSERRVSQLARRNGIRRYGIRKDSRASGNRRG